MFLIDFLCFLCFMCFLCFLLYEMNKNNIQEIVVDKVSATIKTKLSGEPDALKADELLEEFKTTVRKIKPNGLIAITRLCCKSEWDYSVEITFKTKEGLGKFFDKDVTKNLHQEFVKALGEISKAKPHVQNFVHNRWEIR